MCWLWVGAVTDGEITQSPLLCLFLRLCSAYLLLIYPSIFCCTECRGSHVPCTSLNHSVCHSSSCSSCVYYHVWTTAVFILIASYLLVFATQIHTHTLSLSLSHGWRDISWHTTGHSPPHWKWYASIRQCSADLCNPLCTRKHHHVVRHGVPSHAEVTVGEDVGSDSPLHDGVLSHHACGGVCSRDNGMHRAAIWCVYAWWRIRLHAMVVWESVVLYTRMSPHLSMFVVLAFHSHLCCAICIYVILIHFITTETKCVVGTGIIGDWNYGSHLVFSIVYPFRTEDSDRLLQENVLSVWRCQMNMMTKIWPIWLLEHPASSLVLSIKILLSNLMLWSTNENRYDG